MENRYEIFTGLIMNIFRCIQKIKNVEMEEFGLKGKQVQCLFALYNSEHGATATELREMCGEDKGAMSRTVKELEICGLLFVDETENKKYKNPIKLTEDGKKIANAIAEKISEVLKVGSQGVGEQDREKLYETLTQISNNLSKICENYGGQNG